LKVYSDDFQVTPPHGSQSTIWSYYYLGWRSPFSNFRC
jgi:hypothetical protein